MAVPSARSLLRGWGCLGQAQSQSWGGVGVPGGSPPGARGVWGRQGLERHARFQKNQASFPWVAIQTEWITATLSSHTFDFHKDFIMTEKHLPLSILMACSEQRCGGIAQHTTLFATLFSVRVLKEQ